MPCTAAHNSGISPAPWAADLSRARIVTPTPFCCSQAFDGVILVWGASIAVQTHGVSAKYSESRHMAIIIYNTLLLVVITTVLVFLDSLDLASTLVLIGVSVFIVQLAVLTFIFAPKFYAVAFPSRHVLPEEDLMAPQPSQAQLGKKQELQRELQRRAEIIQALSAEIEHLKRQNSALAPTSGLCAQAQSDPVPHPAESKLVPPRTTQRPAAAMAPAAVR